jgi:hypothetical protein
MRSAVDSTNDLVGSIFDFDVVIAREALPQPAAHVTLAVDHQYVPASALIGSHRVKSFTGWVHG